MKILYVDYFQKDGHVNFNRIHIDALRRAGHQVDLVLHHEIAQQLPYPDADYALQLPRLLRFREGKPLVNRVVFFAALLLIMLRVRVKSYDKVFLGCIDEISYGILPLRRDAYIYAHGNGRFLPAPGQKGSLKFRMMQRLAPRATFVVFNDYMAAPFRAAGFPNVKVVSHGCVPAFGAAPDGALASLPFRITPDMHIVFHPSGKCNEDFVRKALADTALQAFLAETNTHLVLRNRPKWADEGSIPANIHFVNGFLSTELYQALFLRADAILMCYPASFHHQVSGVSFECVANQKLVLALAAEPLTYLRDYYNYDPLFADIPEFTDRLRKLFAPSPTSPDQSSNSTDCRIVATPDSLMPRYADFF